MGQQLPLLSLGVLAAMGCAQVAASDACEVAGVDALAACLTPTQEPSFYVQASSAYFDTMDKRVDRDAGPVYAELVARWEWPPWLKLTGFERQQMINGDKLLRLYPSIVEDRDCRFYEEQPFGRCRVTFYYDAHEGRPCPIYEEFTFNDQGEMTFIEAWSDLPAYLPAGTDDPWAEGEEVHRLSTRIPGLGGPEGRIELDGAAMEAAAADDADVADFVLRANDFASHWTEALEQSGDALWSEGCGWE